MYNIERIIASICIAWTIFNLLVQWLQARGNGRVDYSVKAGDVIKGVIYNFTWAMTPRHKETIRLHPGAFIIGVLMHIGIFLAIIKAIILIISPQTHFLSPFITGIIFGIGSLCGLLLLVKRISSVIMRSMSSPDDYISILLTIDFMAVALLHGLNILNTGIFLVNTAILFFYLPLGKLRHVLFFFVARTDFGIRLGYRGTYPANQGSRELPGE